MQMNCYNSSPIHSLIIFIIKKAKLHLTGTAEQVLIKLRDWAWWCLITRNYSSITSLTCSYSNIVRLNNSFSNS